MSKKRSESSKCDFSRSAPILEMLFLICFMSASVSGVIASRCAPPPEVLDRRSCGFCLLLPGDWNWRGLGLGALEGLEVLEKVLVVDCFKLSPAAIVSLSDSTSSASNPALTTESSASNSST